MSKPLKRRQYKALQRKMESQEFDRIETYLSWPHWSANEASLILAGIDIDDAPYGGPYRFLPGASDHLWGYSKQAIDWSLVELRLQQELEISSSFIRGVPLKPLEWLEVALKVGCEPCWAPLLKHAERKAFGPAVELVARYATLNKDLSPVQVVVTPEFSENTPELVATRLSINELRSSGGKAKHWLSRSGDALRAVVHAWDLKPSTESKGAFRLRMLKLYGAPKENGPMAGDSTIISWVRDLAKESEGKPWERALFVRERDYKV